MKNLLLLATVFFSVLFCSCTSLNVQEKTVNAQFSLADYLHDRSGNAVETDAQYLLVYYAADWCPYCVAYADQLKETYTLYKRMYGNVEIVFAGHINDLSNQDLLDFLDQGEYIFPYVPYEHREASGVMALLGEPKFYVPGFLLLDRAGNILSSSNGTSKDDYFRDRPLVVLQDLLVSTCATCQ